MPEVPQGTWQAEQTKRGTTAGLLSLLFPLCCYLYRHASMCVTLTGE